MGLHPRGIPSFTEQIFTECPHALSGPGSAYPCLWPALTFFLHISLARKGPFLKNHLMCYPSIEPHTQVWFRISEKVSLDSVIPKYLFSSPLASTTVSVWLVNPCRQCPAMSFHGALVTRLERGAKVRPKSSDPSWVVDWRCGLTQVTHLLCFHPLMCKKWEK